MEKVIISFEIQEIWIQDRDIAFFSKTKNKTKKTFSVSLLENNKQPQARIDPGF